MVRCRASDLSMYRGRPTHGRALKRQNDWPTAGATRTVAWAKSSGSGS